MWAPVKSFCPLFSSGEAFIKRPWSTIYVLEFSDKNRLFNKRASDFGVSRYRQIVKQNVK